MSRVILKKGFNEFNVHTSPFQKVPCSVLCMSNFWGNILKKKNTHGFHMFHSSCTEKNIIHNLYPKRVLLPHCQFWPGIWRYQKRHMNEDVLMMSWPVSTFTFDEIVIQYSNVECQAFNMVFIASYYVGWSWICGLSSIQKMFGTNYFQFLTLG